MPTWGELLVEIQTAQASSPTAVDDVRRKYLAELRTYTGRSTVLYATDFLNTNGIQVSVTLQDKQGLMEVFKDLSGPNLDLILHSPGGAAEATDSLVRYMRSKFDHVRVFVPFAAMSAATMWAMAADEIVMGKHSQLGPIDPQITLPSGVTVSAGAVTDQFKRASDECAADASRLTGWLPTLQQYVPGLLDMCSSSADLAKRLVAEWSKTYMFGGRADKDSLATELAEWLCDYKDHLSHGRAITRDQLAARGVPIIDLEDDPHLQDAVLSVHHATMHTLMLSPVKIIENHLGKAFILHGGQQVLVPGGMPPMPQAPPA